MNTIHDDQNEVLKQVVDALRVTPERDPNRADRGKRSYLAQASAMVKEIENRSSGAPVSVPVRGRLKGWIRENVYPLKRKEGFSMLSAITAVMVSLALLFGGTGATVFAAQESIPGDVLYPVKTFSEDLRLQLSDDVESQLDLLLTFAGRRVEEMVDLHREGEMVPQSVADRWLAEMDAVFSILGNMDSAEIEPALQEVGVYIRKHDRDMLQGRTGQPDFADPVMAHVQAHMRLQIGLTETGSEDPLQFQNHFRNSRTGENTPGSGNGEGGQLGAGYGYPWVISDTLTNTISNTVPLQSQYGPGGQNQGETTHPDEGYGPGEQNCVDCDPPQDGSGPGPGPGPENNGETTQPAEGYGPAGTQTPANEAPKKNNGGSSNGK